MIKSAGLQSDSRKTILNIESAADLLGISTATARNWVKSGWLAAGGKNNRRFFYKNDIEAIKQKLLSGELERLKSRANKTKARRAFVPEEHISARSRLNEFSRIINFVQKNNIKTTTALFLLSLNLLKRERVLLKINIQDIIKGKGAIFKNKQIQEEISSWLLEIKKERLSRRFSFLLDCSLPKQRDILGIVYQSLLFEGEKSQSGSYYTPSSIVNDIIKDYVKKDSKALDPSCGTGQFLLAFADIVKNPLNIYGVDCDKTAVRIARLNILIKFKGKNFAPNIFCKNALFDIGKNDLFSASDNEDIKNFDIIAGNPPWGARFSKSEAKRLKNLYPQISSSESFSYFLVKSADLLSCSGIISFILPESILNVGSHRDIREIILKGARIKKIVYLNRVFKNVFSPAIRLDLEKSGKGGGQTAIYSANKKHKARQIKWMSNHDFIFDIHTSALDSKIIDKIYNSRHTVLKNQASWALGIVTGNNKELISYEKKPGLEPIYRGKDIKKFIFARPSCWIQFRPGKFQQAAREEKYRAKEKLVYRFISKNLTFAYDSQKRLILNSANMLIPQIPGYPIKAIAALFNSSLYQLLFQKKFFSVKVLRSHIESLPLPLWDKKVFSKIVKLTDKAIKDQNRFQELDSYISSQFALTEKEARYVNVSLISSFPQKWESKSFNRRGIK